MGQSVEVMRCPPIYLHLMLNGALTKLESVGPFKVILVIGDDVMPEWQAAVSDWLVRSGCRYMMAWGRKRSEWDDSVDDANLRFFNYKEIPEDEFVMATGRERDSLKDVSRYATHSPVHPSLELGQAYIIHVAPN